MYSCFQAERISTSFETASASYEKKKTKKEAHDHHDLFCDLLLIPPSKSKHLHVQPQMQESFQLYHPYRIKNITKNVWPH